MKLLLIGLLFSLVLSATAADAAPPRGSKLRHVVAFKFKDGTASARIEEVVREFRALKKKIRQIDGFEWGTNTSPEKHDKGFTHQFILTFRTAKARDEYLVHPDHQAFGKVVGPVLADVFVIDFWTRD